MSANEALTERVSGSASEDNYTLHKYMLSMIQRQSTESVAQSKSTLSQAKVKHDHGHLMDG